MQRDLPCILALVRISCNSQFWSLNVKSSSIFQRLSLVSLLCIYLNERNVLIVCPREHRFQWSFASLRGLPRNSKRQSGFCFGFFQGKIDSLKIGKMYEALTAMECNQLLWGFRRKYDCAKKAGYSRRFPKWLLECYWSKNHSLSQTTWSFYRFLLAYRFLEVS